nr:hypothetical protein [Tanacetum cinerariifolium]
MVDWLSNVETDKVIHTVETDIVMLVDETKSFVKSSDEFKETRSSNGLLPKQADLICVHALNELHSHEIHVVLIHHNAYSPQTSIPQLEYVPTVNQQHLKFSPPDLGLNVLVLKHGDDPIDAINHMMSFLTSVVRSRFPTTNNQIMNSSNPRQQDTFNNRRVTLQTV